MHLTGIMAAMAEAVAKIVYPFGLAGPSAAGSPARVYPGWPQPQALDADVAAGVTHVTVYPGADESVRSTAIGPEVHDVPAPLMSATVAGGVLLIGGPDDALPPGSPPHVVSAVAGSAAAWVPIAVSVAAGDTYSDIAARIAAALAESIPGCSATGRAVSVPVGSLFRSASVASGGSITRRVRIQRRGMQVIVWAPTPEARDRFCRLLDGHLSAMRRIGRDDDSGLVAYRGSSITDEVGKLNIYRLDFRMSVEYATTVAGAADASGAGDPLHDGGLRYFPIAHTPVLVEAGLAMGYRAI